MENGLETEAIRTQDKVLLILSENAIASDWGEDEATKAFVEERGRHGLVVFPARLDGALLETVEPWAGKLRDNRNCGDFTRWKERDAYQETFQPVLRDLTAERERPFGVDTATKTVCQLAAANSGNFARYRPRGRPGK